MVDKLLISNNGALTAKYGNSGLQAIQAAIAKLIAADQGRGLQTIYVAVDDQATMQGVHGTPVTNANDPQQNKSAVDALFNSYTPQYAVLLGAVDVIPHMELQNPAYNPAQPDDDPDQVVPSDLPYACAAPYSQNAADFIAPARVVSRLPDVTAANDPAYLVHILDVATNAAPFTHADYANDFGVSAAVWCQSTKLSVTAVFGAGATLQLVPPAGYQWPAALLSLRSHFFNCHGAPNSPQYYGQSGQQYPAALDAAYITGKLTPGTVAAAECCYGAALYDPSLANGQMPIPNVYLAGGAYGFWGSTTIAYGPATSNANADLICQYFMKEVLSGASLGRAALAARLTFANSTGAAISPVDLKTLAQFILLGDASLQGVPLADAGAEVATKYALAGVSSQASQRLSRINRRHALAAEAAAVQATKAIPERSPRETRADILKKLEAVRAASGLQNPGFLSFRVMRAAATKAFAPMAPVAVAGPTAFHLMVERTPTENRRVLHIRVVEVTETDGEFVRVRELFSR